MPWVVLAICQERLCDHTWTSVPPAGADLRRSPLAGSKPMRGQIQTGECAIGKPHTGDRLRSHLKRDGHRQCRAGERQVWFATSRRCRNTPSPGRRSDRGMRGSAADRANRRANPIDPQVLGGEAVTSAADSIKKTDKREEKSTSRRRQEETGMFYESTMRERPVISLGWGMPRSRNIVGAMSIAVPLLRRLVLCSSSTRITGTRLVVWAVWGIPVS